MRKDISILLILLAAVGINSRVSANPSAGKRVRVQPPECAGTDIWYQKT